MRKLGSDVIADALQDLSNASTQLASAIARLDDVQNGGSATEGPSAKKSVSPVMSPSMKYINQETLLRVPVPQWNSEDTAFLLPPDIEPVAFPPTLNHNHEVEQALPGEVHEIEVPKPLAKRISFEHEVESHPSELHDVESPKPPAKRVSFHPSLSKGAQEIGAPKPPARSDTIKIFKVRTHAGIVLHLREIWRGCDEETLDGIRKSFNIHVTSAQARRRVSQESMSSDESDFADERGAVCRCPVAHPAGAYRLAWNAVCLFLICLDILMIPMSAFDSYDSLTFIALQWFCTIFWSTDLVFNFRTGYFVGSRLEMRPRAIAYKYATTWMMLDGIIVLMEWVGHFTSIAASASLTRTTRSMRTLRFLKLLRLAKMRTLWFHFVARVNSNSFILIVNMSIMTVALMLLTHLVSCSWYAIGESQDDGWTSYVEYDGSKNLAFWYLASQRWSIAQLNGRTDLNDNRNMIERGFTVFVGIMMAVIAKAIFTSVMTKTLLELSSAASEKNRRRRTVNEYLETHQLSTVLSVNVKQVFHEYQLPDAEINKEKMILQALPPYLRNNLLVEVRSPRLLGHSLFSDMSTTAPRSIRRICTSAVHLTSSSAREVVFDRGDPSCRMLFVDTGALTYGEPDKKAEDDSDVTGDHTFRWKHHVDLLQGRWLCEPALWVEWLTQGRLVAERHSCLLELQASGLHDALRDDRILYAQTVVYALRFIEELGSIGELTDFITFEVVAKRESAVTPNPGRKTHQRQQLASRTRQLGPQMSAFFLRARSHTMAVRDRD